MAKKKITPESWSDLIAQVNEIRASWRQNPETGPNWVPNAQGKSGPTWANPGVNLPDVPQSEVPSQKDRIDAANWNSTFKSNLNTTPLDIVGDPLPAAARGDHIEDARFSQAEEIAGGKKCHTVCPSVCTSISHANHSSHNSHNSHSNHFNHSSHDAHSSHSSHGNHGSHNSHTSHTSHNNHGNHSSHDSHSNHGSHNSHSSHSSHSNHANHGAHTSHSSHSNHGAHRSHSSHDSHSAHANHMSSTHTDHANHANHGSHNAHSSHTASFW